MLGLKFETVRGTLTQFPSFFQFNNAVIQSKALWELIKIYEEASSLPNKLEKRRRRRRRQTQMLVRG